MFNCVHFISQKHTNCTHSQCYRACGSWEKGIVGPCDCWINYIVCEVSLYMLRTRLCLIFLHTLCIKFLHSDFCQLSIKLHLWAKKQSLCKVKTWPTSDHQMQTSCRIVILLKAVNLDRFKTFWSCFILVVNCY